MQYYEKNKNSIYRYKNEEQEEEEKEAEAAEEQKRWVATPRPARRCLPEKRCVRTKILENDDGDCAMRRNSRRTSFMIKYQ